MNVILNLLIGALVIIIIGLSFVGLVGTSAQQTTEEDRYRCYFWDISAKTLSAAYCARGAGTTFANALDAQDRAFTVGTDRPSESVSWLEPGDVYSTTPFTGAFVAKARTPVTRPSGDTHWVLWSPTTDSQTRGLAAILPLLFIVLLIIIVVGLIAYFQRDR